MSPWGAEWGVIDLKMELRCKFPSNCVGPASLSAG
jgi:hypothetical protein